MKKTAVYQAVVLALGIIGLSGCGGGSSSGSVSSTSSSTTVSGTVVDAPITGARVCLMDGSTTVACATSDAISAAYSLTFDNSKVASGDLLRIIATKGNITLVSAIGNLAAVQAASKQDITQTTTAQFIIAKAQQNTDNIDPSQLPSSQDSSVLDLAAYIQSIVDPCLSNPLLCQPTSTAATNFYTSTTTSTPTTTDVQNAIAGKTIGNRDNAGNTVIEMGSGTNPPYSLYQYNNDNTYTTQTGTWSVSVDSNGHPTITLNPITENGTAPTLRTTVIHVSSLLPENSAGTMGAVFVGTTNSGTTSMAFNISIPMTSADVSGKTLTVPDSGTSNHNIVFNANGTGVDYTPTCGGTAGVAFNWSISSNSLVMDESSSCTGEIFHNSLLNKSISNTYWMTNYSLVGTAVDGASGAYPFSY